MIDIVETLGNCRTIAILMNESRVRSAHKNTESVNAKLRSRMSSSIRGQLAANKHGIVRILLKAKITCFWKLRVLWVTDWVRCIGDLEFDKEAHFREICLGIALRFIILGIEADIWRTFVTLGIWIGVWINEHPVGGEWCRCSDLLSVSGET